MRPRTAYTLATAWLLLTAASLALWAVSHWRSAWVSHQATTSGTITTHSAWVEWSLVGYVHTSTSSGALPAGDGWDADVAPSDMVPRPAWNEWSINQASPDLSFPSRTTHVALAGFGIRQFSMPRDTSTTVHLPLWATAAVPAFLAHRLYRRARRLANKGLCPHCGYDLRTQHATQSAPRCPECGTTAPATPPPGLTP